MQSSDEIKLWRIGKDDDDEEEEEEEDDTKVSYIVFHAADWNHSMILPLILTCICPYSTFTLYPSTGPAHNAGASVGYAS